MAVVADYMDGNCRIVICDDYCVKTQEEKDKILKRVADIYVRHYTQKAMAEIEKNKKLKEKDG